MSLSNWITVIGGVLTIVSVIKWAKEKGSFLFNFLIIGLGLSLVIISLIKNVKDDNKEIAKAQIDAEKDKKIDSLQDGMKLLVTKSIQMDEFQKYLREKPFNLIRDSITNKPIQINTFNTNLRDVQNLQIGPRN